MIIATYNSVDNTYYNFDSYKISKSLQLYEVYDSTALLIKGNLINIELYINSELLTNTITN